MNYTVCYNKKKKIIIIIKKTPFLSHENYGPQIDSTQLMIIAQTFKISVVHTSIYRFSKGKLSFSMGIRREEGGLER